ncbi:SAM-dependent methyltransferase [Sphingosinicella terrae]|uniref:SAM-dependent methyltransferase n=1 Tax=Sphingosinicella terrae TaxID=2172047 RepID=UPI0013B3DD9E|nr:class I SAM-dependent methyltransferase [Sphingosinicella terrae]
MIGVGALAAWRLLSPPPEPERARAKFDPSRFVASDRRLDAPYVATDYAVVDAMLAMARVRPNDYVIDLGSGDGRILIAAARSHGARGLGIEIDRDRIREAQANAEAARVSHLVQFRNQDLFETPLGEADVLTLYLTQQVNLRLRPRILEQMRPGSRVVSNEYDMGDWRPDERQRIGSATLSMWIVPARFAGRWTFTEGGASATVELQQTFQEIEGTATSASRSSRVEQGRAAGRRISFVADLGQGRKEYRGWIDGDRLNPIPRSAGWQAQRAE